MQRHTHFLVIDLEATCDRRGFSRHQMETIEIGAVMVRRSDLAPVREMTTFIRPVRRPRLTPFCTELTTITQAMVDGAPLFPEAARLLEEFVGGDDALFCSWGFYDRNQLRLDAEHHGIRLPLTRRHWNLKDGFSEALRINKRFGLRRALRRVGLEFEGTHHRGIDDARNIARLLPWCLGRADFPDGPALRRRRERRPRPPRRSSFTPDWF